MRALGLVLALASCTSISEDAGTWEPIDTITGPLAPEVGPPPAARAAPSVLRVATWNVHFGADPDNLADQIGASTEIAKADVLFVQEIEAYPDEPATRARRLAERLGMTWIYAPARVQRDGTHGIAILSRFPLADAAIRKLPFIDESYNSRPRNAVAADVTVGGAQLRVVNLHLDVRIGPVDRIRQLHPAVIDLPETTVIGGDFNSNPSAWVDNALPLIGTQAIIGQDQAAVVDDYMFAQDFAGALPDGVATMRIPLYDIRIDNLYARATPILAAGVEHVDGSDHWPVWFDVAVP